MPTGRTVRVTNTPTAGEAMGEMIQKPDTNRPRIVVYEKRPNSNFRLRILYLQLVMMAGR